jgi:hypothetical protein
MIGLLALVVLMVTLLAAPASALRPDRFKPGPNPDLTLAGICDFPVLVHDVVNNIVVTDFFDREGNLIREHGGGMLVEQMTRLDAQNAPVRSITRNISGPGTFTFDEDGATLVATGNWLFFFAPDEVVGYPDGLMWLTSGRWVWRFNDDGTTLLVSHTGMSVDVCSLLA